MGVLHWQSLLLLAMVMLLGVSSLAVPNDDAVLLGPVQPTKDAFYTPPAGYEHQKPGAILRSRTVPSSLAVDGVASAFQILYRSSDSFEKAIATVTTILIPKNADNTKLLSYQVAEDAANINCAPSYVMQLGADSGGPFGTIVSNLELKLIGDALKKGWYVAVPDFLGPKSAFLANTLAGHTVLDGIRAVLNANFTNLAADPKIGLWGYSGGSLASGFAAELHPVYAPELKIAGAALGGTVPDILSVLYTINQTFFAGLIAAGIVGLSNEYPDVADLLQKEIIPSKADAIKKVKTMCLGADVLTFASQDIFSYTKNPAIFNGTLVKQISSANNPGRASPQTPLFVYKGAKDQISPVADTDKLIQYYCGKGASVEYMRVADADHLSLIFGGSSAALNWLSDRLAGTALKPGCFNSTEV